MVSGQVYFIFGINLETFLRGMETRGPPLCQLVADGTLKPSLEGWKLFGVEHLGTDAEALKPSLEGWKPSNMMHLSGSGRGLETFLRGMETWKANASPSRGRRP